MIKRVSPLDMGLEPHQELVHNGWPITLSYKQEKSPCSLFITDLSHIPKWSLQGSDLVAFQPAGLKIPVRPGEAIFDRGILIVRLTPNECRIMVFDDQTHEFTSPGYIELADAYAVFAVVGPQCLEVLSKLSPVDLESPYLVLPSAAQAPVEDIPCLVLRLEGECKTPGLIVSAVRGYGQFLLNVFMDAGREYGITPGGWERFRNWLRPKI
ncbi:MAG: hypothetical protein V1689_15210 [Pseudomonadota bacterium]